MKLNVFVTKQQVQKFMRCKSFDSSSCLGSGRKICARQPRKKRTSCRFIHTGGCLHDSESSQDKENNASGLKVIDYTVFIKKSHPKDLHDVEEQSEMQLEKSVENLKNHEKKITKC